jgi:hypothetical protein
MQAAADDTNDRNQSDHTPTVKDTRSKLGENIEAHDRPRMIQRRRYVNDPNRSSDGEPSATQIELGVRVDAEFSLQ